MNAPSIRGSDGEDIVVVRANGPLRGVVRAQPSKNYLSRYLWTAALCPGVTRLEPMLPSDDARALLNNVQRLGASVLGGSLEEGWIELRGFGSAPRAGVTLDPDNAGAVLRFLLGATALVGPLRFETDRMDSLGTRPNRDLLDALASWGVSFPGANAQGTLPLESRLDAASARRRVGVSGAVSSQFLSSLLLVAPLVASRLGGEVTIEATGDLKSRAAVETTLDVLARRGIAVEREGDLSLIRIAPGEYRAGACRINGDWPGAAAILCAAAAVPGSHIRLEGLGNDAQGERHILAALEEMGCSIEVGDEAIVLAAPERLQPLRRFNGDLMTDAVPPLMAVCTLADGTSRIENVENLRYKECNRITDPLRELGMLGVSSREELAAFEIDGRPGGFAGGVTLDGHRDHRVIFLLTICGMRSKAPVKITSAGHVSKSYPRFFEHLRALGAHLERPGGATESVS